MGIDRTLFKSALGSFAAGVTVITTVGREGEPYGLTATAFSSVSIDPPLVLVCVDKKAESYPHFGDSGLFAVNLLEQTQAEISQRFATSGGEKFENVTWHRGALELPLLDGTVGALECRLAHAYDGGDHTIFVGEVESAQVFEGQPLTYFRGSYRRVEEL